MKVMQPIAIMFAISLAAAMSASAQVTLSGPDLSGLFYHPNGGVAQYVAGTPDVAQLSTPDSGLSGPAPVVYVRAANVGLSSLGTLSGLTASYHLFGTPTGPSGAQPYWLTYLYDPFNVGGLIGVVSMGGPTLDSSSQIHVFYDFDPGALSSDKYWSDTLSQLDGTAYGTTTFGQLGVYETGVEIGDWDNGTAVITASANIDSITVNVNVPDVASTVGLLGLGFLTLAVFGFRQNRLQAAK